MRRDTIGREPPSGGHDDSVIVGDLLDGEDWKPLPLGQQGHPNYKWFDGTLLADAPIDFAATFDGGMWVTRKPIDVNGFNRNPLRVRPNFVVPRHHHNFDEMIFVLQGEYSIDHGEGPERAVTLVKAGECFMSEAGTPYTMTAGPEGVTYIETWPDHVIRLETYWYRQGWVGRS